MILTTSDVSSLAWWVTFWEWGEYIFAALVTIACFGEFVSEFTRWYAFGDISPKDAVRRKRKLEKSSTILLVFALTFELICLVRSNSLSGQLIGSLADTAERAESSAQGAEQKSTTALTNSGTAITNAAAAELASEKAQQTADNVSDRAAKLSAKLDADEKAEVALRRFLWMIDTKASPRSLNDGFVKALKDKPKGTAEIWVFPNDKEAYLFSTSIQNALRAAGWTAPEIVLIPEAIGSKADKSVPPDVRWGMSLVGDLMIFSREPMLPQAGKNTAAGALLDAFMNGRHGVGSLCQFSTMPQLPADGFVIMVGQRISNIGSLDDKLDTRPKNNPKTSVSKPH